MRRSVLGRARAWARGTKVPLVCPDVLGLACRPLFTGERARPWYVWCACGELRVCVVCPLRWGGRPGGTTNDEDFKIENRGLTRGAG